MNSDSQLVTENVFVHNICDDCHAADFLALTCRHCAAAPALGALST